jgi:hypothetical protein
VIPIIMYFIIDNATNTTWFTSDARLITSPSCRVRFLTFVYCHLCPAAMKRTVKLPLLLTLSLLSAAVCSASSSTANLYLHPAAPGKGRAVEISPAQANQVLAHLFDVPGESLGASAGLRDAWDWIIPSTSGKEAVQNLFGDSKQRSVILFTDLDSQDAQGK